METKSTAHIPSTQPISKSLTQPNSRQQLLKLIQQSTEEIEAKQTEEDRDQDQDEEEEISEDGNEENEEAGDHDDGEEKKNSSHIHINPMTPSALTPILLNPATTTTTTTTTTTATKATTFVSATDDLAPTAMNRQTSKISQRFWSETFQRRYATRAWAQRLLKPPEMIMSGHEGKICFFLFCWCLSDSSSMRAQQEQQEQQEQ